MKIINILILNTIFLSCQGQIGCPDDENKIYLVNPAYKYNCGLFKKELILDDYNNVCSYLESMESPVFAMINNHELIVEINFDDSNFHTYQQTITLAVTENYGNIFQMQDGLYYKNDELAETIIELLEIKDIYKETEGDCEE